MHRSTIGRLATLNPYGGQYIINLWQNYQTTINYVLRSLSTTAGQHYTANKNTISAQMDLATAKDAIYIARPKIISSDADRRQDRKFATHGGRKY
jgi:hypothetical protein